MPSMQKKLQFSIRKLALGTASVVIGAFLLGGGTNPLPVSAQDGMGQVTQTAKVGYLYLSETDLIEAEKALVEKTPLSSLKASQDDTYILVYRPKAQAKSLVETGDKGGLLSLLAGGTLLLVTVSFAKDRKKKVLGALLISLSTAGISHALAENPLVPLKYEEVTVSLGQALEDKELAGYDYVGVIADEKVPSDGRLHQLLGQYGGRRPEVSSEEKAGSQEAEETKVEPNKEEGAKNPSSEKEADKVPSSLPLPEASEVMEVVPPAAPEVELPVSPVPEEPEVMDAVPSTAPEVELPVSPLPEEPEVMDAVPSSAPEVELPVSPLPEEPEVMDAVPSTAPEVELPVSPLPEEPEVTDAVPSTAPEVELPVSPLPEEPEVMDAVPSTAPEVELPVSPLPEEPEVMDAVPSTAPEVELPVSPLPEESEVMDAVPSTAPEVELPVSPLPEEPAVIDAVPSTAPEVELPVSPLPEEPEVMEVVPPTAPEVDLPVSPVLLDKAPLDQAIGQLEANLTEADLTGYTATSVEAYQAALMRAQSSLTAAREGLAAKGLTQTEMDKAISDLENAQADLLAKRAGLMADTKALNAALERLGHVIETGIDRKNSRPKSIAAYDLQTQQATSTFNTLLRLLNKPTATVAELAQAVKDVEVEIGNLTKAKEAVLPILDKSALTKQQTSLEVAIAREVDLEGMDPASVASYKEALKQAKDTLDAVKFAIRNKDADEATLQERASRAQRALAELEEAIKQVHPDMAMLRKARVDVETAVQAAPVLEDKTEASVANYQLALTEAKNRQLEADKILARPTASKQEVDAASQQLAAALTKLNQAKASLETVRKLDLTDKKVEFKNVESAYLYKMADDKRLVKVLGLEQAVTDTSPYQIQVNLADGKSVWLNVTSITEKNGSFTAVGSLPELVQFTNNQSTPVEGYSIQVAKHTKQQGLYTSFKDLVDAIKKNPAGEFIIGADLTASEVKPGEKDASYLDGLTFMGTLKSKDGQVYRIHDLVRPLFKHLYHGKVSDLHLENVAITASNIEEVGSLANRAEHSTITNVSAVGSVMGSKHVGGLVGVLDQDSTMTNVSFEGKVSSSHSAGGLAAVVARGSRLANAYANVSISSYLQPSEFIGGLVGQLNQNATLENAYVKGSLINSGHSNGYVGGAVGSVYGETTNDGHSTDKGKIANVISFAEVTNGHDFIGNLKSLQVSKEKTLTSNHLVTGQSTGSHLDDASLTMLSPESAETKVKTFYTKPNLNQQAFKNQSNVDYSQVSGYRASHAKAYKNLEKLMPFYDRVTMVKEGNKLADSDSFVTKEIASVQAYMGNQLARDFFHKKQEVSKILVRYTDGSKEELQVSNPQEFKNSGIVDYTISGKQIAYHPHQLVKDYASLAKTIAASVANQEFNEHLFNPYNLMDWEEKDRKPKIERLYLRDHFQKAKAGFEQTLVGLIEHHMVGDYTSGRQKEVLESYLKDNAKALLAGLTYLERWYDFSEVKDSLLYGLNTYGSGASSLDMVARIGGETIDVLRSDATQVAYLQVLADYTNGRSLPDFIQKNYELFHKDEQKDIDSWMKVVTKAYITTRDSKELAGQKTGIFNRLSDHRLQKMLLPLLTIKEEHVYAILSSNSSNFGIYDRYMYGVRKGDTGYEERLATVRDKVNATADSIQRYFNVLYRLLSPSSKERLLKTSLLVFDGYSNRDLFGTGRQDLRYTWSREYGEEAFESVKAFAGPIRHWMELSNYATAYAMSGFGSEIVHYSKGNLLEAPGLATLTHEHTHNLDDHVILDGHYRRGGHGPESFAMGLFESPYVGSDVLGINLIYDAGSNQGHVLAHNSTPERFENIDSLNTYMRRVFDVLYTLEAAEGEALIKNNTNYLKNHYHILSAEPERLNNKYDDVSWGASTLEYNRPKSLDELVDRGVVGVQTGYYGLDDYIKLNMFEAHFGIMENSQGASGGLTLRRVGYELLAEKGYYDGMLPYISSKYALSATGKEDGNPQSDSYILKQIFNGQYASFKDFRKAMFKRRKEAAANLKPVTFFYGSGVQQARITNFQDIVDLMQSTMRTGNRYAIPSLKRAIFNAYLQQTNEFRESIYIKETPTKP